MTNQSTTGKQADNRDERPRPSSDPVDVRSLMARIRARVKQDLENRPPKLPRYTPPKAKLTESVSESVLYSDELNYLNSHWNDWSSPQDISSHRKISGKIVVFVKKRIQSFLWNSLFKTYFEREREFQMQLVRYLNAVARYIDARDTEIFWQLNTKLDNDVTALCERGDRLFVEAFSRFEDLKSAFDEAKFGGASSNDLGDKFPPCTETGVKGGGY